MKYEGLWGASGHLDTETLKRIGKDIAGALVKPFEHKALVLKLKSVCGVLNPAESDLSQN